MKKIFLFLLASLIALTGCSSTPPMPPEPKGPLVKVNIEQPHTKFGGNK